MAPTALETARRGRNDYYVGGNRTSSTSRESTASRCDDQGQVVPTESEAEQQRAEEERRRAESAETELAQLRVRLAELETGK